MFGLLPDFCPYDLMLRGPSLRQASSTSSCLVVLSCQGNRQGTRGKRCIPLCSDGWFAFFEKKLSRKKTHFYDIPKMVAVALSFERNLSLLSTSIYLHMFSLKYCLIQKEGIHCWRHLLTDYCMYILQRAAITLKWVLYNASYTSP